MLFEFVFTVSNNEAHVFTSGLDMIQSVSAISVSGGGDCPELAADGIIRGMLIINNTFL